MALDNSKETERAELHRTIWGIANDLRNSVDGWDFKQYVLGMLFYRYISGNPNEHEAGDTSFRYASLKNVDVLDQFDVYAESLQQGLPAEILACQKQYVYYRDKLLSFKGVNA